MTDRPDTAPQLAAPALELLDVLPVMLGTFDPAGRVTWINRALERSLGWSLEEWQRLDVLRLCHPDPAEYAGVSAFLRDMSGTWRDFTTRARDGTVMETSWVSLPWPGGGGVGVGLDITPRKKLERERDEQARLVRSVLAAVPDVVYLYDVRERRNLILTGGGTEVLGVSGEEVRALETGWQSLMHPDDYAALPEWEREYAGLADDAVHEAEFRMRHRDGEYRWFCSRSVVFRRDADGSVRQVLGVAHDDSRRRKADAQARDYSRRLRELSHRLLEVQEQERRHLARELHDEFGGALTGLMMMLAGGAAAEPARERLRELINRARDLSLNLRPSMLDDLGLVPALLWLFGRLREQTGLEVRFRRGGVSGRLAPAVETAAYRIVQEALTNVVRYSGQKRAGVRLALEGDGLRVRVADRGHGFDPRAARRSGRTGGLSGMSERATLLGGTCRVLSRPGRGTVVVADIPIAAAGEGTISGDSA